MSLLSATILSLSPVLYARFSETSGATVADSSGNGLTGTANGTYTRNVAGGAALDNDPAISLTANTDYVNFGQPAELDFTTAISWFLAFKNTGSWGTIGILGRNLGGAPWISFALSQFDPGIIPPGGLFFGLALDGTPANLIHPTPSLNEWHTAALTYDGATVTAYLDDLTPLTAARTGTITDVGVDLWVGENQAFGGRAMIGSYDEFAMWGTAFTAAQYTRIRSAFLYGRTPRIIAPGGNRVLSVA